MKQFVSLAFSSFVITLAAIAGLWAGIRIDTTAKDIGFSDLERATPVALHVSSELPSSSSKALLTLMEYPQLLPYPLRVAVWGMAVGFPGK